MRIRWALAAACALAACAAKPPEPVVLGPSYRDPAALIGVTSRYDDAKFAGVWYVREGFDPAMGRTGFNLLNGPKGRVMRLGVFVCESEGACGDYSEDLPVTPFGKGQFRVVLPDGKPRDFWVLWVDESFRTAVLGNKTGEFGWIIDRSTKGGADRIKAAREILDFNGYDVSKLRVIK